MFYTQLGYYAFLLFPSLGTGKMTSEIIFFCLHVQKVELKQAYKPQSFARIETRPTSVELLLKSKQKCILHIFQLAGVFSFV